MRGRSYVAKRIAVLFIISLFFAVGAPVFAESYSQGFNVSATIPLVMGLNDPETLAKNAAGDNAMVLTEETAQADKQEIQLVQLSDENCTTMYAR